MSNTEAATVSYGGGAALSPLAPDMEMQADYIAVDEHADSSSDEETMEERFVQDDGTVVIKVTKKKKIKKATNKVVKNANELADATVKLVAVAVDNMVDTSNELPPGVIKTGEWDARLLSCFDHCVPNCFMATFCPCVTAAQVASRIGYSFWNMLIAFGVLIGIEYLFWIIASATLRSTNYRTGYISDGFGGSYAYTYAVTSSTFTVWGWISMMCALLVFVAIWQLRSKVREKFTIPGSPVEDFLVSCFCSCCSLAQMATHVKSYKPGACDFGPPDELHAYTN